MAEKKLRAIVTGGSRGIGRSIVKELANNHCSDIMFTDIAFKDDDVEACANELKAELSNKDVNVFAYKADATSLEDANATIAAAIEKMGGVDILVNNAGITRDNLLIRMSEQDFDAVIATNLKSVFNYTKAAIKPMMKQRYGRVINIASVVGLIGNPGQANYVASKAGVIGFTKTMAKEVGSRNITCNAIAPGFIETEMTHVLNEDQRDAMLKQVPLGRPGSPEDVAKVIGFLCTSSADYLTGQVFAVDGGMTM